MYLSLYANCILVKGIRRSLICDLQRHKYFYIPNDMASFLTKCSKKSYFIILERYSLDNKKVIDGYIKYLLDNDLAIFYQSKLDAAKFPKLSEMWDSPFPITNLIVDIGSSFGQYLPKVVELIENLCIPSIQFRSFEKCEFEELWDLMLKLDSSSVSDIQLVIKYSDSFSVDKVKRLLERFLRINSCVVHSAPSEVTETLFKGSTTLLFITKILEDESCCGVVNERYFSTSIKFYTESLQFNNCLNRKLSIDKNGRIKNCPSLKKDFGSIGQTKITDVISSPEFTSIWKVNKAKVNICKICEFRHVCSDCRAYLEQPDDVFSKPLKCGYDPYTATWHDWSTNPLKQKVFEEYKGASIEAYG